MEEKASSDSSIQESTQSNGSSDSKSSQVISSFVATAKEERLFTRLMHSKHRNACRVWSRLSRLIHTRYPPQQILNTLRLQPESHPELMVDLQYAVRHSACAYRPAVVAATLKKCSLAFKSTATILMKYFSISKTDIIINTCGINTRTCMSRNYEPAYYLAVDHKTKKIVLSIRGTQSVGDTITDLKFDPCSFTIDNIKGTVHGGMLQSAYSLRDSITETLIAVCNSHPEYKVLITGHSLGAGVAALLGLMYRDHPIIHKQHHLRVYAFASPCIVSKEFTESEIGSDYITSIAVNTDLVTRLSAESLRKYHLRQDLILKQPRDVIHECMRCIAEKDIKDHHHRAQRIETRKFLRVLGSMESPNAEQELFPLGRILWFISSDSTRSKSQIQSTGFEEEQMDEINENKDNLLASNCNKNDNESFEEEKRSEELKKRRYSMYDASSCRPLFQELVITVASFREHLPGKYLSACGVLM